MGCLVQPGVRRVTDPKFCGGVLARGLSERGGGAAGIWRDVPAARGVLGRTPSIGKERGQILPQPDGAHVFVTAHPSYLLRLEGDGREREEARFREDLARLATLLRNQPEKA